MLSFLKCIFKNEPLLYLLLQRKNQACLRKHYMNVLGYSNIFNSLGYFTGESYLQGWLLPPCLFASCDALFHAVLERVLKVGEWQWCTNKDFLWVYSLWNLDCCIINIPDTLGFSVSATDVVLMFEFDLRVSGKSLLFICAYLYFGWRLYTYLSRWLL